MVHPTRSNLTRHERPGPRHLLEDGELPVLVRGLEIVRYEEGWTEEDQHDARLVARRASPRSVDRETLPPGDDLLDGGVGKIES